MSKEIITVREKVEFVLVWSIMETRLALASKGESRRAWLKLSHIPFVLYDEYNGDVAEWSKAPHC